jgi:uncharacterized membrane protein
MRNAFVAAWPRAIIAWPHWGSKMRNRAGAIKTWYDTHRRFVVGIALSCITVLGGALRAAQIGTKSFWYDEAVIYWVSRSEISSLVSANARQNSAPPLFVYVVHLMSRIATDEATLRSVSWLAGTLAIPAIFMLARKYVSSGAALITAVVVAVSPVYVEYSQELREYSLAFLLSTIMFLAYVSFRQSPSWWSTVFVLASFCAGVLTQYGLAVLVLSLNLALPLEIEWRGSRGTLKKWALAQAGVVVAVAWVISSTLRFQFATGGFGHVARGYFQGPLLSLPSYLFRQTYELVLFSFPDPPLVILLMGTAIAVAATTKSPLRSFGHLVVPFIMAVVAGVLGFYPYVGARQGIYLFPILCMLIAMGFEYLLRVDRKGIVALLLALLVTRAALLATLGYLQSEGIENLKPLAGTLTTSLREGDRVFVCEGAIPAFRYYFRGPLDKVTEASRGEGWQEELSGLLSTPGRVWLVVSHCGDVSTYVDFAARRRPLQEVGSSSQAWLFLSP